MHEDPPSSSDDAHRESTIPGVEETAYTWHIAQGRIDWEPNAAVVLGMDDISQIATAAGFEISPSAGPCRPLASSHPVTQPQVATRPESPISRNMGFGPVAASNRPRGLALKTPGTGGPTLRAGRAACEARSGSSMRAP